MNNNTDTDTLIQILNTIYNNNIIQITALNQQNSEITNRLINILEQTRNSNTNANNVNGINHNINANNNNENTYNNNNNNNRRSGRSNRTTNGFSSSSSPYSPYNRNNLQSLLNSQSNIRSNYYAYTPDDLMGMTESIVQSINGRTANRTNRNNWRSNRTNRDNINQNSISQIFQQFLEPVQIYPTTTQIEIATRNVLYRDIVTPRNTNCPISLETFTDNQEVAVIRYCGHIFNREELTRWFRSNCKRSRHK